MLYVVIGFVAFFAIFYIVVYPIIKKKHEADTQNFEATHTGKETIFREELFNTNFKFITDHVNGKPQALSQCLNYRTTTDIAKEMAASAARSIMQRSLGGTSRDVNKKVCQSYLANTDTHLYYIEFDEDDFELTQKMVFEINQMKNIQQTSNQIKQNTKLSFMYEDKDWNFQFYPTGIMALSGFGKKSQELRQKAAFALVKPFVEFINKLTNSTNPLAQK